MSLVEGGGPTFTFHQPIPVQVLRQEDAARFDAVSEGMARLGAEQRRVECEMLQKITEIKVASHNAHVDLGTQLGRMLSDGMVPMQENVTHALNHFSATPPSVGGGSCRRKKSGHFGPNSGGKGW